MTAMQVDPGTDAQVTPLLGATEITKRYAGIVALEAVSVSIEPGGFVGLLGPNGAGKTTLFDCLTGKQRPDGGTVRFDGVDLLRSSVHQRARRGIAQTFQRMELFSGLSVRDHLRVGYRAKHGGRSVLRDVLTRGTGEAAERARCNELIDLVGLERDAERPIEALSLGRGRLVELARALITDPRLLFLDEPSSGLDRSETEELGDVLRLVQRETNVAIVLVEHDVPMVERLVERVYVLDAGRLIAEGSTAQVLASAEVRRAYLGIDR